MGVFGKAGGDREISRVKFEGREKERKRKRASVFYQCHVKTTKYVKGI